MADAASASASASASEHTTVVITALPYNIIALILQKISYTTIYKLHLEGNKVLTRHLVKEGKKIITLLENLIHPDAGYSPISADFDFTNLDLITKHIWNMLICVSSNTDSDMIQQLLYHACAFISMECDAPDSYYNMCSDIWEFIIIKYLDSEYDEITNSLLGDYKKWKYIFRAIKDYPGIHGLNTLAKQKYALSILIMTYLQHKDEIMHLYDDDYYESEKIDTNEKYYYELKSLIATVSGNRHLDAEMVSRQFVKDTFYFMS